MHYNLLASQLKGKEKHFLETSALAQTCFVVNYSGRTESFPLPWAY